MKFDKPGEHLIDRDQQSPRFNKFCDLSHAIADPLDNPVHGFNLGASFGLDFALRHPQEARQLLNEIDNIMPNEGSLASRATVCGMIARKSGDKPEQGKRDWQWLSPDGGLVN